MDSIEWMANKCSDFLLGNSKTRTFGRHVLESGAVQPYSSWQRRRGQGQLQ